MHRFRALWQLAWVLVAGAAFAAGCPKMKKRKEYNKMLWTAEVNENIERLYQALFAHHLRAKDKKTYRFPAAGPTPVHIPCGRTPHKPDPALWLGRGWKELGFSISDKFRYQYRVISVGNGPGAGFIIRAHGDLDCDGVYSTYERTGQLMPGGRLKDGLLSWDKEKELE